MSQLKKVWPDREIRFDSPFSHLEPRKGEFEIDSINSVEDTKGNNGEKGALSITNLRIIWCSHDDPRTNLSVGLNCISSVSIKKAASALKGSTQGLYLMTRFNRSRFEFIFTSLVNGSPRLFTTVQAVYRAYQTTKMYRDLKLRGAIIKNKELLLLPREEIFSKVDGVWNLSSEQGNLGCFYVTNVRVVWFSSLAENFNASVPFLQIASVSVQNSRFGKALVIAAGGYKLGFRVDPPKRLLRVFQEIKNLHKLFSEKPELGVHFLQEKELPRKKPVLVERKVDDEGVVEDVDNYDALAVYYADGKLSKDDDTLEEPVYDPYLGLAVEKLPEGVTVKNLWSLFPPEQQASS